MAIKSTLLLCIALISVITCYEAATTPEQQTKSMIDQLLNHPAFLSWTYGGGIIQDAMWLASSYFEGMDYTNTSSTILDSFETTQTAFGYRVLNNITIPWEYAIGDFIGLYPFAYLDRVEYYGKERDNTKDLYIVDTVLDRYVLKWPVRLADGTIARKDKWTLWCDDMYMGLTLMDRVSIYKKNQDLINQVATMKVNFAKYMQDPKTGLFWHGYDDINKEHSCCFWGRANGWVMMSHIEALLALEQFPGNPNQKSMIALLQSHATATIPFQSTDGRWHQVIDHDETYLETSVTAMFLWSYVKGVMKGWLNKDQFDTVIHKAYEGLSRTILTNGTVTGICQGTGVQDTVAAYNARSTNYIFSTPGLGSVIRAVIAYDEYTK